jgi:hypothetical protein
MQFIGNKKTIWSKFEKAKNILLQSERYRWIRFYLFFIIYKQEIPIVLSLSPGFATVVQV